MLDVELVASFENLIGIVAPAAATGSHLHFLLRDRQVDDLDHAYVELGEGTQQPLGSFRRSGITVENEDPLAQIRRVA